MTTAFRNALGAASLLPLLSYVLMQQDATLEAIISAGSAGAVAALVVLGAGISAVLYFAWLAAGAENQSFVWKLGWVLALTLFGVLTAPVFWWLHVRTAPEAALA